MTPPDTASVTDEAVRLRRRLTREHSIRLEAESIAEKGLRDLYERQRELLTLERIATHANQDNSIRDVLRFSLEEICQLHGWKAAHGYILNHATEKSVLSSAGIWYSAKPGAFEPFRHASQCAEFGTGNGLPGRAYACGIPVWISDLAKDKNFPRLGIGLSCGLRSAVAFPVLSGDAVVAVLEFFDTEIRDPSESLLHMLAHAGTQLGRVIERQRSQEALAIRAAELLKARDAAEAADKAKSAFLAAMSHELRTPLNAIIGFSEMMLSEIDGTLSARYKDYAGDIQRSGLHLKNVINNILDLSKIAVGELTLHEMPVSLTYLVENCERIVSPMAAKGKVTLIHKLGPNLPTVQVDETRLQQAVINVLSNAIKFTPPTGSVTVNVDRAANGDAVITVSDTGIGMTPHEIIIAMEPFRQIDSSLSRRYEGTGLGLPLAKAFIQLHGGKLFMNSTPHVGTEATLVIPSSRCLKSAA